MSFDSRPVAIITGSSRGIGRCIAERLADSGHAVVINYLRSAASAEQVAAAICERGGQAIAVQADIGQSSDRGRLIGRTLQHFQRLDVLVNNAGITSVGRRDLLEAS